MEGEVKLSEGEKKVVVVGGLEERYRRRNIGGTERRKEKIWADRAKGLGGV